MKVKDGTKPFTRVRLKVTLPALPNHDLDHPLEPVDATELELRAALQDLKQLDDAARARLVQQFRASIAAAVLSQRSPIDAVGPPLPALSDAALQAVQRRGRERPWSGRTVYRMSPFEWVRDTYGEWIPGLLQSHLKLADPDLYIAFAKRVSREGGRPAWLDVPSVPEANLRNETDPVRRAQRLAVRSYVTDRRRARTFEQE